MSGQIAKRCAALPVLDRRPADEILGYDERGLHADGRRYFGSAAIRRTNRTAAVQRGHTAVRNAFISAATVLRAESCWRLGRGNGWRELDLFLHRARFEVASVDAIRSRIARAAFRKYGKGRHTAGLKLRGCFSYALAKASGPTVGYQRGRTSAPRISERLLEERNPRDAGGFAARQSGVFWE